MATSAKKKGKKGVIESPPKPTFIEINFPLWNDGHTNVDALLTDIVSEVIEISEDKRIERLRKPYAAKFLAASIGIANDEVTVNPDHRKDFISRNPPGEFRVTKADTWSQRIVYAKAVTQ